MALKFPHFLNIPRKLALCASFLALLSGTTALSQSLEIEALIHKIGLKPAKSQTADLTISAVKRYAIVVGNSAYKNVVGLKNANADASLVADFLRDQGYVTHEYHDATKQDFEGILRRALFDVDKDTEVVFYFAGHGLQIGSKNYLVPVNASLKNAYDVPFETVSLQSLVSIIGARARSQVLILDSCRDNPFGPKSVYSDIDKTPQQSRSGFSVQTAPVNSLLAFSTSPGGVALDGTGANSPYTAAFVNVASRNPELTIGGVLEKVRRELYENTLGYQVPWESSTLIKPMYFNPKTVFNATSGDTQPFAQNTATRSLALLAISLPKLTQKSSKELPKDKAPSLADTPITLTAPMEDEVEIGAALRAHLKGQQDGALKISKRPEHGMLAVANSQSLQLPLGFASVTDTALDNLVYVGNSTQLRAAELTNATVIDQFIVQTAAGQQRIELNLQANDCDVQAGDYLDPDGVGLARYPNEIEPELALAACMAAVTDAPDNGRFQYQLGRALLALRKTGKAKNAFEQARNLGHTRAWYALGDLAANEGGGNTEKQAPELALALYGMGVKEGDPYAFYALGRELMRYESDIRRQREGFELMTRALEVGHTFAMNELGYFYLDKDTAFYDPERGLRYLQESAAREDIYGYNNMGLVYQRGLGETKTNFALAEEWYRKAAKGGHPNAPTNLGRMYYEGQIGGRKNYTKAVEWYDKGLERGDAWGGANAAWVIANKRKTGFTEFDAAERAAKAATLRNAKAAEAATKTLNTLPKRAINGAAQQMLNRFGAELAVDGAFGAGSKAALLLVTEKYGVDLSGDPKERLRALAQLHWSQSKFRVDLY